MVSRASMSNISTSGVGMLQLVELGFMTKKEACFHQLEKETVVKVEHILLETR